MGCQHTLRASFSAKKRMEARYFRVFLLHSKNLRNL